MQHEIDPHTFLKGREFFRNKKVSESPDYSQEERFESGGVNHGKNIVEVERVSFSYGTDEVLTDITLNIHKGDYLGVIGPNGAGKTTLLKIMLGIIVPSRGSVKIFGTDIKEFNEWEKIGYVPQQATHFDANFPATVREAVLMGRYGRRGLLRKTNQEDRDAAMAALQQVGLGEYKDRLIGDLSGGQQQRVFIARALAGRPEIIFLDEPTTGVDQATQDEFYALLRKLNREFRLTLILISHDIERVAKEAMHIACIDRTLICHTSPEEFFKSDPSCQCARILQKDITHNHHRL